MKTKVLTLIAIFSLALAGCAKDGKKTAVPATQAPPPVIDVPEGPHIPDGNGPGNGPGDNWEYGSSASLDVVSLNVFSGYTGRPMNDPKETRVHVNLTKKGSNSWGGTITITYKDNDEYFEGHFTSGSSEEQTKYNVWLNQTAFHGVFEDYQGGLVLVIDDFEDTGDGGSDSIAGGSVWFKNFGLTYAPHPPKNCWFVSLGPYDCRPWPDGDGMNTLQSINPNPSAGYTKLGTFSGLDINEAFNQ